MTAAVYRSTPSLQPPHTQNTAPVLDFNCLYTRDVRRKAKRWQDGFLRYHTFNKRIMVYDVPRNFVGDAHWTTSEALQDGDELMLEKDGILVQVAESIGRTETDLTELRKSAKKAPIERATAPQIPTAQTPTPRLATSRPKTTQTPQVPAKLKHRSLDALLGTGKSITGKAELPAKSPFELRQQEEENVEWNQGRPPKRQRLADQACRTVSRGAVVDKLTHQEKASSRARTAIVDKQPCADPPQPKKQKSSTEAYVDLSKDDDDHRSPGFLPGFSSDALYPLSSPTRQAAPVLRSSSSAFQTHWLPHATKRQPAARYQERPRHDETNERRAEGQAREPRDQHVAQRLSTDNERGSDPTRKSVAAKAAAANERPADDSGRTLRMTSAPQKKKSLLCQEQLSSKFKRTSSTNTDCAAGKLFDAADDDRTVRSESSQQRKLQARLARIDEKAAQSRMEHSVASSRAETPPLINKSHDPIGSCATEGLTSYETSAYQLALLDRQLLPSQRSTVVPPAEEVPITRCEPRSKQDAARVAKSTEGSEESTRTVEDARRGRPKAQQQALQDNAKMGVAEEPTAGTKRVLPQQASTHKEHASEYVPPQVEEPKPAAQGPPPPPLPLQNDERPLRRVVSEASAPTKPLPRRIPGAPMRFTHAASKQGRSSADPSTNITARTNSDQPTTTRTSAFKTKKSLQRAVSYNVTANGTATVMLGKPFQQPKPPNVTKEAAAPPAPNPWSREAFDLFTWRPPGWDEENWCAKEVEGSET